MTMGRWQSTLRFGLPGVLAGLMLGWALGGNPPSTARAQAPQASPAALPTGGEAAGTIAFTSAAAGSGQLLYLIDTRAQSFAIYRVDPQNPKGTVKLEAARQYRYDLKLEGYNNLGLEVSAIKSMVKAH